MGALPAKIEQVEADIASYMKQLNDPDFYLRDSEGFHEMTKKLVDTQAKLSRYETRWLELEEMRDAL